MHFPRKATGSLYIYGSGLKEKTILSSIINYHFAINAKTKSNTRIKIVLKGKIFKSHTFKEYFPQHVI